jgi:hypothetical protein
LDGRPFNECLSTTGVEMENELLVVNGKEPGRKW